MLGYKAKIRSDYSIYLYAAVAKFYRIINVSLFKILSHRLSIYSTIFHRIIVLLFYLMAANRADL